jgi:hypothetical protein
MLRGNVNQDTAAEMAKIGVLLNWIKFTIAKYKKE